MATCSKMRIRSVVAVLILTLTLLLPQPQRLLAEPHFATDAPVDTNIEVQIDGKPVQSDDDSMHPYINQNGRTMISVRAVAEALGPRGCSVDWNEPALRVLLSCEDKEITFYFMRQSDGSAFPTSVGWIGNAGFTLHTPPELRNGRVFIGLRDLGELLDIAVEYIPARPQQGIYTPTAALWFDRLDMVDQQEYASSTSRLEELTYAMANDDTTLTYRFNFERIAIMPPNVRPQHFYQYVRSLDETNAVQKVYVQYTEPEGAALSAVGVSPSRAELATNRIHALQTLTQKYGKGARIAVSEIPSSLRRYRDKDGTLIEVYPSGEKHYLTRQKAQNLASKFQYGASLEGVGSFWAKSLTKAWPAGTYAMALVALSAASYSGWMYYRLHSYCLADDSHGAVVDLFYIRVPQRIASRIDQITRNLFQIDTQVAHILYTLPYDCEPWSGIEPGAREVGM